MINKPSNLSNQKIRAIITGATGMVGEGVLHECLMHPDVEQVIVVTRKSCGVSHPKLTEIIHHDFFNISALESQLQNCNACFFCMGVSSMGMTEVNYERLTYDLTMHMATLLSNWNPDMVLCYVTGSGTDSTERGKSMWARIKGRTENHLMKLPFKRAYMFRPGYIHPTKGLKNTHRAYHAFTWLYPVLKSFFPNQLITMKQFGNAMINTVNIGYEKNILEPRDILELANK